MGHNQFSDWSETEFEKLLGYAVPAEPQVRNVARMSNTVTVADSVDWREQGMVSIVGDQGMCGSDWAFAAVGAVEGACGVKTGDFVPLSVQQVIDCTGSSTSCQGGTMAAAFDYLETNYAMSAEAYPLTTTIAKKNNCKYDESKATSCMVDSYTYAKAGDIDMMKQALTHQPIAAAVKSDGFTFQMYESGILDDDSCGTDVNHTVNIVGYGSENGLGYWLVKNSWGLTWGEAGYVRIAQKPGDGICGIQTRAVWTVLK